MPVIEVEHLTKEYRLGAMQSLKQTVMNAGARLVGREVAERPLFKALDDVSFSIEQGEVVGIIGHNGAGKSTLLKMLARISTPTSGTVKVNGRIAPLIEVGAGFVPDLTGRENVYLNGAILGMSKREIDRKFDEIVDFAEMAEFIDTPVKRYSSGMQIKLAFSVATNVAAEIILIDEVLAVGDISFQHKCIDRMESLIRKEGRTVLIVGHNIRILERICSRALLFDHGKLSHEGIAKDICSIFFREAQQRTFLRQNNIDNTVSRQRGVDWLDLIHIDLLDESGLPTTGTSLHGQITLRIALKTTRLIERAEIIVGLHTQDFVHIISVSSAFEGIRPTFTPGTHELFCSISDIPLRPFIYGLRVGILDQNRNSLWYGENLVEVLITAGTYDITAMPEVGLVSTPATWKFTRIEQSNSLKKANSNAAIT